MTCRFFSSNLGLTVKVLLNYTDIISLAVKQEEKPAVWVSNNLELSDRFSSKDDEIYRFVLDQVRDLYGKEVAEKEFFIGLTGSSLFFFETEEEQYKFYDIFQTPTVDSSGFYAMTIDKYGNIETENT